MERIKFAETLKELKSLRSQRLIPLFISLIILLSSIALADVINLEVGTVFVAGDFTYTLNTNTSFDSVRISDVNNEFYINDVGWCQVPQATKSLFTITPSVRPCGSQGTNPGEAGGESAVNTSINTTTPISNTSNLNNVSNINNESDNQLYALASSLLNSKITKEDFENVAYIVVISLAVGGLLLISFLSKRKKGIRGDRNGFR